MRCICGAPAPGAPRVNRKMARLPGTLLYGLGVFSGAVAAAPHRHFDGSWTTVLSCPNARGALGYSFEFPATVHDDVLHAQKGTQGEPGWLQIDGAIGADGAATLYAKGLVGAAPYAVGDRPAGTEYGYHIEAHFAAATGSGQRVEGRPCSVTFTRRD
jgi:hypothetical protein